MSKTCSNKLLVKYLEQSDKPSSAERATDLVEYDYCCLCRGSFECLLLEDVSVVTLKKCFPEMRQRENYKYQSCELCRQSLHDFHAFTMTCTNSTRKIQEFCRVLNVTLQDVNLFEVYHFLYNPSTSEDTKNILMSAIQIKNEEDNAVDYLRKYSLVDKNPTDTETMFKCENCKYETKYKNRLKRHLLVRHKSPKKIEMFKCELCPYETNRKSILKRHSVIHKSPTELELFKCELCPFETKHKNSLTIHALIHKKPVEVTMFKCETCDYETKYKHHIIKHSLTHKNPTEIEMFKCELCAFETKYKTNVKKHSLIHKGSTEVTTLKCEKCLYRTKYKQNLKRHLLMHKRGNVQM